MNTTSIALTDLMPSKTNDRRMDAAAIERLAVSMKDRGLLQPLLVRPFPLNPGVTSSAPMYEVVCGERRFRAATKLGWKKIDAVIRELTNEEAQQAQLVENLQRENLHPLEEALAYKRLIDLLKIGPKELAARIGRGEQTVRQRMRLLLLSKDCREAFLKDAISATAAFHISRLPNHADQDRVLKEALRDGTHEADAIGDLAQRLVQDFMLKLAAAPFAMDDEKLYPQAGSCIKCPKRTGSEPLLFPDVKGGDLCLDGACFEKKTRLFGQARMQALRDKGKRALNNNGPDLFVPKTYGATNGCDLTDAAAKTWAVLDQTSPHNDRFTGMRTGKTLRQIMDALPADKRPGSVFALDNHGRVRELITRRESDVLFKKYGVKSRAGEEHGGTAAPKETPAERAKRQREREAAAVQDEVEKIVYERALIAAGKPLGGGAFRVARTAAGVLIAYTEAGWGKQGEAAIKAAKNASGIPALARVLVHAALESAKEGAYSGGSGTDDERIIELAAVLGIKAADVKREVLKARLKRAKEAAAADGKAKGAKP
jgi:ParB/RepB/Spo0J family partition protein